MVCFSMSFMLVSAPFDCSRVTGAATRSRGLAAAGAADSYNTPPPERQVRPPPAYSSTSLPGLCRPWRRGNNGGEGSGEATGGVSVRTLRGMIPRWGLAPAAYIRMDGDASEQKIRDYPALSRST